MALSGEKLRNLTLSTNPDKASVGYLVDPATGDYKVGVAGWKAFLDIKGAAGVAYVSPTYGSDTTGTVGDINLPFLTYNAALLASRRVYILENTSVETSYLPSTITYFVYIPQGVTLTFNSGHRIGGSGSGQQVNASYIGEGNISFIGTGVCIDTLSCAKVYFDLNKITFATGRSGVGLFPAFGNSGMSIFVKANLIDASALTNSAHVLFSAYNSTFPTIIIGEGTKIYSGGIAIFQIGGPGTNPKIHVGAGVLIYTSGSSIWISGGSTGGLSAAGAYSRIVDSNPDGSIIVGSLTAASWITPQHTTCAII